MYAITFTTSENVTTGDFLIGVIDEFSATKIKKLLHKYFKKVDGCTKYNRNKEYIDNEVNQLTEQLMNGGGRIGTQPIWYRCVELNFNEVYSS